MLHFVPLGNPLAFQPPGSARDDMRRRDIVVSFALVRRCLHPARRWLLGLGVLVTAGTAAVASDRGPQGVVREFCQDDGLGERVNGRGWTNLAPLVAWALEPAWDHVVLISSYTVGAPRPDIQGTLAVDVSYAVVGQLSALELDATVYVETVTFRVQALDAEGWRIAGPPPAPHIFAHRVDIDQMRRSLQLGGANFVSDSLFVYQMLRYAGWNVAFERTADLLNGTTYRSVERPAVGDLVVYLRDDVPYHVGLWEAENQVVSSTLNAGVVRDAVAAFAGEVKYLRLVEPEADAAAHRIGPRVALDGARTPATPAAARVQPLATPRPASKTHRRKPTPRRVRRHGSKRSSAVQHSTRQRVNTKGKPKARTSMSRRLQPNDERAKQGEVHEADR